jgi:hypothetical protein
MAIVVYGGFVLTGVGDQPCSVPFGARSRLSGPSRTFRLAKLFTAQFVGSVVLDKQ